MPPSATQNEVTTWYEVYAYEVQPFTVVRETDKCLYYLDKYSREPVRRNKEANLFRTEAEAKTYLLKRAEENLKRYREHAARTEAVIARLKGE